MHWLSIGFALVNYCLFLAMYGYDIGYMVKYRCVLVCVLFMYWYRSG